MMPRRPLILALALLPALLSSCGSGGDENAPPPPSRESAAAIRAPGGSDRAELGRAIDALFEAQAVGETRALLVWKGGEVLAERYGGGAGPRTRLPGWSAGECVTALMTGALVSDGRLRLAESAPVKAWERNGDPRGEITLLQLLQMRAGLRHADASRPERESDRMRMLFLDGRDHMAAYAEAQPLESAPGERFEFSAATGVILGDVAGRALADGAPAPERRAIVGDYLRSRLFGPLGMTSALAEFDRAGTLIGGGMIHATAADWARLGEFIRHKGSVKGAQILPRRWVEFMLRPSSRNPAYGAGVWLNREGIAPGRVAGRDDDEDKARPLGEDVPSDAFACVGDYGQYVIGSPRQLLTVVRLGETSASQREALRQRLERLIALFPRNP